MLCICIRYAPATAGELPDEEEGAALGHHEEGPGNAWVLAAGRGKTFQSEDQERWEAVIVSQQPAQRQAATTGAFEDNPKCANRNCR